MNSLRLQRWAELLQLTNKMLELDLKDESQADELLKLQSQAEVVRTKLEVPSDAAATPDEKVLIRQILHREQQLNAKLVLYHQELSQVIVHIQQSIQRRDRYQVAYQQSEGYFIDQTR